MMHMMCWINCGATPMATVEDLLAERKGSQIILRIDDSNIVQATLVAGVRALVGSATTAQKALQALATAADEVEKNPYGTWGIKVLGSPLGRPACVVLYSLEEGVKPYFTMVYGSTLNEMDDADIAAALDAIETLLDTGSSLVSWGGLGNDLKLLAAADRERTIKIALRHYDLAFTLLCHKGFTPQLATLCEQMDVPYNERSIGWEPDPDAAIDTAAAGLHSLLLLVENIEFNGSVAEWKATTGRVMRVNMGYIRPVVEAMELPLPDMGWMKSPPQRSTYTGWMSN